MLSPPLLDIPMWTRRWGLQEGPGWEEQREGPETAGKVGREAARGRG